MKPIIPALIPAILLSTLFLACERKDRDIRIGAIATLTGDTASLGISNRLGYELAVEECNAKGGVLGKPVRLVLVDDKGEATEGAAAAARIIGQDKVVAVLGATLSRVTLAVAPVAQNARIPLLTPSATDPRITGAGDCIFRACYTDAVQATAAGTFAYRDLKARKAACLFDDGSESAKGLAERFAEAFRTMGGAGVHLEPHPTGAKDFQEPLARILQAHPDLLYVPDCYPEAALIARQARELGFKGSLLGADGWDAPRLVQVGGQALEPGYFTCHYSKDDPRPEVQTFVRKFQIKFGDAPDSLAALGYDAAQILLDAIQRAGTTQGPALRDALAATQLQTVSGPIRFDAQRTPSKPAAVLEIKEGKQVYRTTVGS